jgi:hypothetical protein
MATHISQIILDKIEKEKIKPKARWYFVAEHTALWIPGVIVTALGAASVAGIVYAVVHSGFEYSDFIYKTKIDFIIAAAPLLWILSFSLFSSIIVKTLRSTHMGYRLSAKKILLTSFGVSVVIGVCGYVIDETFETNSLIRYPVHLREEQVWTSPQEGRITGLIEKKYGTDIVIRDKNNMLWTVDMSGFGSTTFAFVEEGKSIRIIGTSTHDFNETEENINDENKEYIFVACAVFPWEIGVPTRNPANPVKGQHQPKTRPQNKNPDCKNLLNGIKQHIQAK